MKSPTHTDAPEDPEPEPVAAIRRELRTAAGDLAAAARRLRAAESAARRAGRRAKPLPGAESLQLTLEEWAADVAREMADSLGETRASLVATAATDFRRELLEVAERDARKVAELEARKASSSSR